MTPDWLADGYAIVDVEEMQVETPIGEVNPVDFTSCSPGETCTFTLVPGDRVLLVDRADGVQFEVYASADGPRFMVIGPSLDDSLFAPPYTVSASGDWHVRVVQRAEVPEPPAPRRRWGPILAWSAAAVAAIGIAVAASRSA